MKRFTVFHLGMLLLVAFQAVYAQDQKPPLVRPPVCGLCPPPPCICPDPTDPWGKWEINFSQAWILKGNGLASAPAFEFTPGYRLVSGKYAALFAEAPLVIGSAAQVNYANGPASYRSYFFTPSVRVQFRATKWWRPWFSGGYGPSMGIPNPGLLAAGLLKPDVMVTGATQVGGGINITPFKAGVGFRLEVRDFISRVPNIELGEKKMQQTLVPSGSVTLRF